MALISTNPATGEEVERYDEMTSEEVQTIIERAHETHRAWREVSFEERAKCLNKAAEILRDEHEALAKIVTREMGKPISQARAEVKKCATAFDYYAANGAAHLAPEVIETDASRSYISYQPLGVVLAIMPWNFPFWQAVRFAAPTLMAGNAGLLKHAENVTGCALAIEDVMKRSGFPEGLFRTLLVQVEEVEKILDNPKVAAATLTGSTGAGKAVSSSAGKHLKKTVLELGGSDPYLILEDADLDAAVDACATSRLQNSGQSCIAAKRFIVAESLVSEFQDKLLEKMKAQKMGDPTQEDTDIGPQARPDLRDALHEQVTKSVDAGAKLLLGGELPDGPGAFYPPTILADVTEGMPAYDEEVFGPVAAIITAKSEEDAIRIANDTLYGLGAAVFTRDRGRGEQIAAEKLHAGNCFVNAFVKSDPRLPFGGIKESGYGRELSKLGIHEFVNIKTVYVA